MSDLSRGNDIRASDKERDAVVQHLQAAYAEGRLDVSEYQERLDAATEVFSSLQAPAATMREAARQLEHTVATHVVGVVEALVENPVQGHGALRKGGYG